MDSTPEELAEGANVVRVLAAVLERLVGANTTLAQSNPGTVTKFHALKAPGISIHQYLERIHKYASCSTECFVLALIYIDRLIQRNNFLLTELNIHRVVITAVLLAAKFFDDAYYNNAYYAKVGGVLVSEMNSLEVEFLFRINFSLHVASDVFHRYRAELAAHSVSQDSATPATNVSHVQMTSSLQFVQQHPTSTNGFQPNYSLSHTHHGHHAPQTHLPISTRTTRVDSCGQQITPSPPPHAGTHPIAGVGMPIAHGFPNGQPVLIHRDHSIGSSSAVPQFNGGATVVSTGTGMGSINKGKVTVVSGSTANGYAIAQGTAAPPPVIMGGTCAHDQRQQYYPASSTLGDDLGVTGIPPGVTQHFIHAATSHGIQQ